MLRRSLALGLVMLAACSSSDDTTSTPGSSGSTPTPNDGSVVGDIRESVTWEDGTKLGGVIRIVEGVTVTIAPNANITCNEATQLQLGGTLKVSSADKHAKISCPKWTGIIVAKNGKLDIDGLDIENAAKGYATTAEAGECVIKNSKVLTSVRPFEVGEKSTLTLDHVEASVPAVVSTAFDKSYVEVYGKLDAKFLTYEAQTNEGIMVHTGGDLVITDSTLTAHNGQDLVSSYGGNTVNVSYTTMSGAHCGIHMQGVKDAVFDHVTSTGNYFGITIYGAEKVTMSNSNLSGSIAWLDLNYDHGPINFDNVFLAPTAAGTAPNGLLAADQPPPVTQPAATAAIEGAGPRTAATP